MPTVERVSGPSVDLAPVPGVRATTQMDVSGRSPIGAGLGQLADVTHRIYQEKQDQADTAQVLQARSALGDWERKWFDPANPEGVYAHQGLDALKLHDKVEPDFEKAAIEAGNTIKSRRAQQQFAAIVADRRESVLNRLSTYSAQENDKYVAGTMKAAILQSVDRGAMAALEGRTDDQVKAATELRQTILAQAKLTGMGGEDSPIVQQQLQAAFSSMHSTAVKGMLARGDVDKAGTYFHDNVGDMTAEDSAQVMALLRPSLVDNAAQTLTDAISKGYGVEGGDISLERVWPAQFNQESGGKQFAADGSPLTSSAGAVGVAQVMPDTGPIAAGYAGVPWDPERFKTDRDYNMTLGKAYMQAMTEQFGSVPLGLAAYNAGPGAVQKWLASIGDPRKGQISLADFVDRIPYAETKGYVRGILRKAGASLPETAGRPLPKPGATFQEQMVAAEQIADKDVRRAVQQNLRTNHALEESARSESERSTMEAINVVTETSDPSTPLQQVLSPDQFAYAQQHGLVETLKNRQRARLEDAVPQTDPMLMRELSRLIVDKPADFVKLNLAEPSYYDKLAAGDYQQLRIMQAKLKDPKKAAGARADWATDSQRIDSALRTLGLDPDNAKALGLKNAKPDVLAQKAALFGDTVRHAERAFVERTGKAPTPKEKDELVRQVTKSYAEAVTQGRDPFAGPTAYEDFNVRLDPATRERIRARLRNQQKHEPTEAEIIAYASGASGVGVPK